MKTRLTCFFPLALVILLGACREAQTSEDDSALQTPGSTISVEGSGFVLEIDDGRILRGAQLAGATIHMALPEGSVPVRIASVVANSQHPDILQHDLQVPDGQGGWKSACSPNGAGEQWGFPVALPEAHPGRTGKITLTCVSGAIAKCARFGYRPWATGPQGEDLIPVHAACVHMVRADYCGDDQTATRDGTLIDVYDDLGIQVSDSSATGGFSFEAGWTPEGAVCVSHTRWPELLKLDELHDQCPRLAKLPDCTEAIARNSGALLFNRSRINRLHERID